MYSLVYSNKARKSLKKIPKNLQPKIVVKAEKLKDWTVRLDIIKVSGPSFKPIYRTRVGNYRIFFSVDDININKSVVIIDIKRRTTTTYRKPL